MASFSAEAMSAALSISVPSRSKTTASGHVVGFWLMVRSFVVAAEHYRSQPPKANAHLVMTLSLRPATLKQTGGIAMGVSSNQPEKRDSLNIRIKAEDRCLIDRAAQLLGKNRTDFVLDAARRAAEDALLDSTMLVVSPEALDEFWTRLEKEPQPNERLRRAMNTPAPWENPSSSSAKRGRTDKK
jgi:uncharacterized protein (DUF1778 family)